MKKSVMAIIMILIIIVFIVLYILSNKKAGKTYVLELEANATTNYFWNYELSDEDIVKVIKDEYIAYETKEEMVGTGGTQIYEFKGSKKGTVIVTLRYERPTGDETGEVETITLNVDDDLNVTRIND